MITIIKLPIQRKKAGLSIPVLDYAYVKEKMKIGYTTVTIVLFEGELLEYAN